MSIITNYNVSGNDLGTLFCDLTTTQTINGVKTFNSIPKTYNYNGIGGSELSFVTTVKYVEIYVSGLNYATQSYVESQGFLTSVSALDASKLYGGDIPSTVTAITQNNDDISKKIATTAYVKNYIKTIPNDLTPFVVGCWMINSSFGVFPIFSSISNYLTLGMDNVDDKYMLAPGYRIKVYVDPDNGGSINLDASNNGTTMLVASVTTENVGSSCELYYNNVIISNIYSYS